MVIRYNRMEKIDRAIKKIKKTYKKRNNKLRISSKRNINRLTQENREFLKSLGFKVLK